MSRSRILAALFVGGVAIATTAYAAQPEAISAQGQAERTCQEQGIQPRSSSWELCLSHVTRAYEWNEVALATQLARAAGDAPATCRERGLRPDTQRYRACVNREIDSRSDLLILGDDQSGVNVAEAR
jgi:hypothetical protein